MTWHQDVQQHDNVFVAVETAGYYAGATPVPRTLEDLHTVAKTFAQFIAVCSSVKREKTRRHMTAPAPEVAANPLKYCALPHNRANYILMFDKSMPWRFFHGT